VDRTSSASDCRSTEDGGGSVSAHSVAGGMEDGAGMMGLRGVVLLAVMVPLVVPQ